MAVVFVYLFLDTVTGALTYQFEEEIREGSTLNYHNLLFCRFLL